MTGCCCFQLFKLRRKDKESIEYMNFLCFALHEVCHFFWVFITSPSRFVNKGILLPKFVVGFSCNLMEFWMFVCNSTSFKYEKLNIYIYVSCVYIYIYHRVNIKSLCPVDEMQNQAIILVWKIIAGFNAWDSFVTFHGHNLSCEWAGKMLWFMKMI